MAYTDSAIYNNGFQPVDMKQQNRFIMVIPTYYDNGAQSYLIRTTDLPNVENNPVTVDTINSEYKIKGKSRWQDISVSFYDPIFASPHLNGDTGAGAAWRWLSGDHHEPFTKTDQYMQEYKKRIRLYYVEPSGLKSTEYWEINGAFFASVNWGSVDVSSDDLVLIEATLSYDWAQLRP
jgi:hypothetical protein